MKKQTNVRDIQKKREELRKQMEAKVSSFVDKRVSKYQQLHAGLTPSDVEFKKADVTENDLMEVQIERLRHQYSGKLF